MWKDIGQQVVLQEVERPTRGYVVAIHNPSTTERGKEGGVLANYLQMKIVKVGFRFWRGSCDKDEYKYTAN